jgi:CubicO group peptidase (beta-lactamase class C family)
MRHLIAFAMLTSCIGPSASLSDTLRPIATVPDAGNPLQATVQTHVDRFVGDGSVSFVLTGPNEQEPQLPAVIIGVVSRGFRGVVTRSRPGAPLLAAGTILPLSSISKAITGILAARDAVEGRFDETTPVSTLLSADLAGLVRDRTVGELVTHTAGYAANPRDLAFTTNPLSPATGYTRAQLEACLRQPMCSEGPAPRGQYLYSNLSPSLLGIALQDVHGLSFETLVQERLASPLGMTDTHLVPQSDPTRWVNGMTPAGANVMEGLMVPPATMGILAPSGELLSTPADMLLLLDVLVEPKGPLGPAIERATRPLALGGRIAWAIDKMTLQGLPLATKSGEQAGYSSMLMWSSTQGIGVIIFSTVGRSSKTLAGLGLEVLLAVRDAP